MGEEGPLKQRTRAQAARALPTGSEWGSKASALKSGDPGDWEEPTYPGPAEAAFLPPGKAEARRSGFGCALAGMTESGAPATTTTGEPTGEPGEPSGRPLLGSTGSHCGVVRVNHKTLPTGPLPEAAAGLVRAGDLQGEPGSVRSAAGHWWLHC